MITFGGADRKIPTGGYEGGFGGSWKGTASCCGYWSHRHGEIAKIYQLYTYVL